MPIRYLDPQNLGDDEDWEGNHADFRCPKCSEVFIVSHTRMHIGPDNLRGYRECPKCGNSIGRVVGGRKSGGKASLEWSRD